MLLVAAQVTAIAAVTSVAPIGAAIAAVCAAVELVSQGATLGLLAVLLGSLAVAVVAAPVSPGLESPGTCADFGLAQLARRLRPEDVDDNGVVGLDDLGEGLVALECTDLAEFDDQTPAEHRLERALLDQPSGQQLGDQYPCEAAQMHVIDREGIGMEYQLLWRLTGQEELLGVLDTINGDGVAVDAHPVGAGRFLQEVVHVPPPEQSRSMTM